MLDKNYWKNRWQTGATGWDAGQPTTPIKEYVDYLVLKNIDKNTRILIPGAGSGHEAVYFYRQGFRNITVCDWAEEAIEKLQNQLPELSESQLIIGDFFNINDRFDRIIEQTFFCAIDPALRTKYAEKCFELLNTVEERNPDTIGKGSITGVLFGQNFEAAGPPFGGTREEYLKYFEPYFDIIKMDACRNSIKPRLGTELWIELKKK